MKKWYVVCKGRRLGIFDKWIDAETEVEGLKCAKFRGFKTLDKAFDYINQEMPGGEQYVIHVGHEVTYYSDYLSFINGVKALR